MNKILFQFVLFLAAMYTLLAVESKPTEIQIEYIKNCSIQDYPPIEEEISVVTHKGFIYVVFESLKLNWMEAHLKCTTHGLHSTWFESREELEFQGQLLELFTEQPPAIHHHWVWTSGNDLFVEGNYTWLYTAEVFPMSFFGPNQPDNANAIEHCLNIYRNGTNHFNVNDLDCARKLSVVCKHKIL